VHAKLGQADAELAVRREILDLVTQLHGTKRWTTIDAQWWLDDRERFAAMGSGPRHFDRALKLQEAVGGEDVVVRAGMLGDAGRLLFAQGDYAGALQRFEQATAVFRKFTLGDGSAPPSTPDPRTAGR
jgi:Tetratricopeptide repeat